MNPNEARLHEVLSDLFPEEGDVVERITDNMADEGYDHSQPVVLGHWPDGDGWYLVDGHMRVKAAIQAGVTNIPATEMMFRDFDEALKYAISRQRDRRNITSDVLWKHIDAAGENYEHGGDRRSESFKKPYGNLKPKTIEETAKIAGTSKRTVSRQRVIEEHGDDDIKEAVKTGKMSHTAGYDETQRRRRERGELPPKIKCSTEHLKKPNDSKDPNPAPSGAGSPKPFKEALTPPQEEEYTGPGYKLGITQEYADALAQSAEIEEACPEYTVAYRHVNAAINHLKKIGEDDPLRDEALQLLQNWLEENWRKT